MSIDARVMLARRLRFLPDRPFAVAKHAMFQGELSTLRRPRTYSQLLAAKNLRTQPRLVHVTADKYAVREHVAERVGERYLIPLRQVVERAEDIDFDGMSGPSVVKGTHGCDMTILLPDLARVDRDGVRRTVRKWLDTDFYREGWRESPYRGLPRRAVVEEFIGDGRTAPSDYKFFMFHGEPAMVVVDQDRFSAHTSTLLSPDWYELDVSGRFAFADALPEQPRNYAEMLDVARALSADFEFARIDLYNVDGRIYFGEITHNPGGGLVRLQPREFDLALGEMWRHRTPLPERFVKRPRSAAPMPAAEPSA
ncbi:MAG: hypothetical protein OJJ54_21050 [Pseudonocardia sp.]|nr:hypothetical protein [Pseudonocardia sp.]